MVEERLKIWIGEDEEYQKENSSQSYRHDLVIAVSARQYYPSFCPGHRVQSSLSWHMGARQPLGWAVRAVRRINRVLNPPPAMKLARRKRCEPLARRINNAQDASHKTQPCKAL